MSYPEDNHTCVRWVWWHPQEQSHTVTHAAPKSPQFSNPYPSLSHTFLLLLTIQQCHCLHFFIRHHIIHVHHCGGVHPTITSRSALGLLGFLLLHISLPFASFSAALPLLSFALRRRGLSASSVGLPGRAPRPLLHPHPCWGARGAHSCPGLERVRAQIYCCRLGRREGEESHQGGSFLVHHRLVRHNGQWSERAVSSCSALIMHCWGDGKES